MLDFNPEGTLRINCTISPWAVEGPDFLKSPWGARVVTFVLEDKVFGLMPSFFVLSRSLLKSSPKPELFAAQAFAEMNREIWCILGRSPGSWILSATSNHIIFR